MKTFSAENIRNVGVISHGGAGKSTLIQSLLIQGHGILPQAGAAPVMRVEPEEISHNLAITPHFGHFNWQEAQVNLVDTPGYFNFLESTRGVLPGIDGAVLIISGVEGLKPETERLWGMLNEAQIPTVAFVNHIDDSAADFMHALDSARETLHLSAQPIAIPIRASANQLGIIDLLRLKAWTAKADQSVPLKIPEKMLGDVKTLRTKLIERIVESDEILLERYLNGEELPIEELESALKKCVIRREIVPVLCGSALARIGIDTLMEAIVRYLPSPLERDLARPFRDGTAQDGKSAELRRCDREAPFSALVLKTAVDAYTGKLSVVRVVSGNIGSNQQILNSNQNSSQRTGHVYLMQGGELEQVETLWAGQIGAITKLNETHTGETICNPSNPITYPMVRYVEAPVLYAIESEDHKSDDKVASGLARLVEEDPTLRFYRDDQTHEMIIAGMGQAHIDIALERLTRKFGSSARLRAPKVPYRETIKNGAKVQGKLKKQTGGHGQFANCLIEVTPLPRNSGFEFVDDISGGVIPRQYIPSVKKGIQEAMLKGPLGGFPVTDIRVRLYDGSFHQVDSSDYAFQVAGSLALKSALAEGNALLLEPIMIVDVIAPDSCTGEILKDLAARRGRIVNMLTRGHEQEIEAEVPLAELLDYGNVLSTLTSGRGTFSMSVAHYRDLPMQLQEKMELNNAAVA